MHARALARSVALLSALFSLAACAETDEAFDEEDYLTSNTALQRELTFQGVVYVPKGAADSVVLARVKKQTQTAFGALRTAFVGVNSRELGDVDPKLFKRRTVQVVDTAAGAQSTPSEQDEVSYTYTDMAVVPTRMARRSTLALAVLNTRADATSRVLAECTANDQHAREFASSAMWYVFEPSLTSCQKAMKAEQALIASDRAKLGAPKTQVTASEVGRLYVPTTMKLGRDLSNKRLAYPEYDKLFSGNGVEAGKLVISMVLGMQADWASGQKTTLLSDGAYQETLVELNEVIQSRPGFKFVGAEPTAELTQLLIKGKTVSFGGVEELLEWEQLGRARNALPAGITLGDARLAAAQLLHKRWLSFEAPVQATVRGTTKPLTIRVNAYFGAESDRAPYAKAIKGSDIFTYNGHSYIGYGPLDPNNYKPTDFPSSYQLFFINSCVSYNYYDADFFPLKPGGTKNLEIVSNGLEMYLGNAYYVGTFLSALISGKQPSYKELLNTAREGEAVGGDVDPLRVVDGELDNLFAPSTSPITLKSP